MLKRQRSIGYRRTSAAITVANYIDVHKVTIASKRTITTDIFATASTNLTLRLQLAILLQFFLRSRNGVEVDEELVGKSASSHR